MDRGNLAPPEPMDYKARCPRIDGYLVRLCTCTVHSKSLAALQTYCALTHCCWTIIFAVQDI
jgi:hypothetical protein